MPNPSQKTAPLSRRTVYTIRLPALSMFSTPKSGVAMPRRERALSEHALSEQRLKRAREDYEQWPKHKAT